MDRNKYWSWSPYTQKTEYYSITECTILIHDQIDALSEDFVIQDITEASIINSTILSGSVQILIRKILRQRQAF